MKFTLASILLLAGLAAALPAGNLNANQDAADAKNTNQKANANANAAANDGTGGITAADKAEAAILLSNNGDAGAVQSGQAFTDAVNKIVGSGNKDEIAVLLGAGAIDKNNKPVDAAAAAANAAAAKAGAANAGAANAGAANAGAANAGTANAGTANAGAAKAGAAKAN